jgi:hypothetical protein
VMNGPVPTGNNRNGECRSRTTLASVRGSGYRSRNSSNLYGRVIGGETSIGAFVEIQSGASVGSRGKISVALFHLGKSDDRGRGLRRAWR